MKNYGDYFYRLSYSGRLAFHPWLYVEKREVKYRGFDGKLDSEFEKYDNFFGKMTEAKEEVENIFRDARWSAIAARDSVLQEFKRCLSVMRVRGDNKQRRAAVKLSEAVEGILYLNTTPLIGWTTMFRKLIARLGEPRFVHYIELVEAKGLVDTLKKKNDAVAGLEKEVNKEEWMACVGNYSVASKGLDESYKKIRKKANVFANEPGSPCKPFLSAINRKILELIDV